MNTPLIAESSFKMYRPHVPLQMGVPAIDRDFKCIDFLTILEINRLDPKMKRKIFGE